MAAFRRWLPSLHPWAQIGILFVISLFLASGINFVMGRPFDDALPDILVVAVSFAIGHGLSIEKNDRAR